MRRAEEVGACVRAKLTSTLLVKRVRNMLAARDCSAKGQKLSMRPVYLSSQLNMVPQGNTKLHVLLSLCCRMRSNVPNANLLRLVHIVNANLSAAKGGLVVS